MSQVQWQESRNEDDGRFCACERIVWVILQRQNPMVVLEGQHFSGSAERLIHCNEIQKET